MRERHDNNQSWFSPGAIAACRGVQRAATPIIQLMALSHSYPQGHSTQISNLGLFHTSAADKTIEVFSLCLQFIKYSKCTSHLGTKRMRGHIKLVDSKRPALLFLGPSFSTSIPQLHKNLLLHQAIGVEVWQKCLERLPYSISSVEEGQHWFMQSVSSNLTVSLQTPSSPAASLTRQVSLP